MKTKHRRSAAKVMGPKKRSYFSSRVQTNLSKVSLISEQLIEKEPSASE